MRSVNEHLRPTPEQLREMLSYDPETGILTWLTKRNHRSTRAGNLNPNGYRYVVIRGQRHQEHRVAWAMHHGAWPTDCIDHVNVNRSDNRLINLREATVTENNRNRGPQSNNTTGFKGVTRDKNTGRYQARIRANKTTFYLGCFDTAKEAGAAYVAAAAIHHGTFGRTALAALQAEQKGGAA